MEPLLKAASLACLLASSCFAVVGQTDEVDLERSEFEYVGLFRAESALDFSRGLVLAGKDSPLNLLQDWSVCQFDKRAWEFFFSGTLMSALPGKSSNYYSFYHPFLEVALITKWDHATNEAPPVMVDAWFEFYPLPEESDSRSEPSWIDNEDGMIPALQRNVRNQTRDFEKRVDMAARDNKLLARHWESPASQVESRLAFFLYFRNFYFPSDPAAKSTALQNFGSDLRQGNWQSLEELTGDDQPVSIEIMEGWPNEIREGLVSHIVVPFQGAVVSFFWHHSFPRATLFTVFDEEEDVCLAWSIATLGADE